MDLPFDVVSLPETDHVEEGETAPDFTRPLVNEEYWEDASLSELAEAGPLLLVFHPMDGAFPTTYVWQEITDRDWAEYVRVVGVSISTPYAHKELIRDQGLEEYALFSDPGNGVADRFGITHDLDGMAGIAEPRPAVFLLAEDRTVEYAWVASEWPDFPNYDAVERELERLG